MALAWLDRTEDWPDYRLALWGEPGCGKTHLLHLWAGRRGAMLLDWRELHGLPTLPAAGGIALDAPAASDEYPTGSGADPTARGADPAAGGVDPATDYDEAALLHLLNAAREARLPVLLAARTPPARWSVRLPDLASRLRAVTPVEIRPPEESLLRALLLRLLADRQLAVRSDLQDRLLLHLPRSPSALREVVARLDRAALAVGGAVTRATVDWVLAEIDRSRTDV
jgi:chromosomal replication initiation ATPase DnaA